MTTAAQNMRDLCRKLLLLGNHFFGWLKAEDSSTACGTSTLKSLLSLGPDAPHVHLRLRKRLARCTLDCGFKTSESPALRGFVAGLRALATAALYLVIFSNGDITPQNTFKTGINARKSDDIISLWLGRRHHQAVFLHQQLLRVQSAAGHAHQGQTAA